MCERLSHPKWAAASQLEHTFIMLAGSPEVDRFSNFSKEVSGLDF